MTVAKKRQRNGCCRERRWRNWSLFMTLASQTAASSKMNHCESFGKSSKIGQWSEMVPEASKEINVGEVYFRPTKAEIISGGVNFVPLKNMNQVSSCLPHSYLLKWTKQTNNQSCPRFVRHILTAILPVNLLKLGQCFSKLAILSIRYDKSLFCRLDMACKSRPKYNTRFPLFPPVLYCVYCLKIHSIQVIRSAEVHSLKFQEQGKTLVMP